MHFTRPKLNYFIEQHGATMLHYPSIICPCVQTDGQATRNCPTCAGWGIIWSTPTTVKANITNNLPKKQFMDFGILNPGSVFATFKSDMSINNFDKFILQDTTNLITKSQILKKGELLPNVTTAEKTIFSTIVSVTQLRTLTTIYIENTDFRIVNGNEVQWITAGPAAGTDYTIKYKAKPEYLIWSELPKQRNENTQVLPLYVVLTRIDMVKQDE